MLDKPSQPDDETILPFIGRVVSHSPGESITIERTLDLNEDLLLADHMFVHAPGIKPVSACMPVAPMTVSLEIMAETAACLAPGAGLIGLENVKASRWIDFPDAETLTLRVVASRVGFDPRSGVHRVAASIRAEGDATPRISAEVLFARSYFLNLSFDFKELSRPRLYELTAEQIYERRHLFHGPSFRCLVGEILLGDTGVVGELLVQSTNGLFRSQRQPLFLMDPVVLDGVGQLVGVWAMERDRDVFPIGIEKLELYRPTPPAGTRAAVRAEITSDGAKTLHANIEVQDGAGAVWMRIQGWTKWKFRPEARFVNFRREPTRHLLSLPRDLRGLAAGAVCQMFAAPGLSSLDAGLLARFYLHIEEMADFAAKSDHRPRQRQWLLGRIAAKDAVRALAARRSGAPEDMLHPASFVIVNDAQGQPMAKRFSGAPLSVHVSIAHCEDRAIAIAHDRPVGVDIERISPRDPNFIASIATQVEQSLLDERGGVTPEQRAEWITRLWCAKEAAGKMTGAGVNGAPTQFEAKAVVEDGAFRVLPRGGAETVLVATLRDGDFIIAHTPAGDRGHCPATSGTLCEGPKIT